MDRRIAVRAAGVGLGVAALAAGAADPALATSPGHLSYSQLGSSAVFAAHPDHDVALDAQARINALATWANALAAKIAAIPSTTVVVGRERMRLEFKLALVKAAIARIDRAATSTTSPLTPAQQAQLASVATTLGAVKAKLLTILANAPAPTPTTAKTVTFARFGTDPTRHHCDGTFGTRDSSWSWWDGTRDGRHHWWH